MTTTYVLNPLEAAYVEELVASGRYRSVDDVVREALQRLREDEQPSVRDLDDLRQAWREGVESGDYRPADEIFDQLEAKYRAMAAGRNA